MFKNMNELLKILLSKTIWPNSCTEADPVYVEANSQVFSSSFSQRGSTVFLLQTDQHLILRFLHVKHELHQREETHSVLVEFVL